MLNQSPKLGERWLWDNGEYSYIIEIIKEKYNFSVKAMCIEKIGLFGTKKNSIMDIAPYCFNNISWKLLKNQGKITNA